MLTVNNSPSEKPSLLSSSGPGNAAGSVRVLATLDRRNLRDAGARRIRFGNRSNQRWPLLLATALCGLTCVGIALFVIHPASKAPQGVAAMATAMPASHVGTRKEDISTTIRGHSGEANAVPHTDAATIINTPINTPINAPINVTTAETTAPSGHFENSSMHSTATDTKMVSTTATHVAAVKVIPNKTAQAPRAPIRKPTVPVSNQSSVASSATTSDSDVDLLAALIARARQRDPTPDAKQEPPCIATAQHSCKP